jgi:hypothetical protein
VRYLGTPDTIELFDVVGVASTNDARAAVGPPRCEAVGPPRCERASKRRKGGGAQASKALRRTEPPEVLRGQLVNYDDTDREMRASLGFYTALLSPHTAKSVRG